MRLDDRLLRARAMAGLLGEPRGERRDRAREPLILDGDALALFGNIDFGMTEPARFADR
jgi:hypothetical protein